MTNHRQLANMPFMPPFRFADQPGERVGLPELARILGITGAGIEESLKRHERVLTTRWRTAYLFYFVAALLFTGVALLVIHHFLLQDTQPQNVTQTLSGSTETVAVIGAALLLLAYAYAMIAFRIATLLSDRYYAETLSAISILYVLAELRRDEPITSPLVKRMLLIRMAYLARSLLLLSYRFPAGSTTQAWANAHFTQMLEYVRERERWVIAPVATTAEVLRQDLASLAPILVLGTYGEFVWPQEHRKRHVQPRSRTAVLLAFLTRGLGFLLPVFVLGYLLNNTDLLSKLGMSTPIIPLVLLAWFLLAVNGMFRLRVIEGFVNLAKAIKDLK
ncbi:MAG TPA: hypothetical protein VF092_02895 [Longimicrobium sp.]